MHEVSDLPSYWIIVARNARLYSPLPLPAFRTVTSLDPEEAKSACMRQHRTARNLESESPKYTRHRIIRFTPGGFGISHFGFLPGGKTAVIIQGLGMVSLWDIDHTVESIDLSDSERSHEKIEHVGRILATYTARFPVHLFDFQVSVDPNGGKHITMAFCPNS